MDVTPPGDDLLLDFGDFGADVGGIGGRLGKSSSGELGKEDPEECGGGWLFS
jgi:hypothetical protein